MFTGVSTAFIKISVFNNALSLVNLYEDDYTGFIAFTKKWCGKCIKLLIIFYIENYDYYSIMIISRF